MGEEKIMEESRRRSFDSACLGGNDDSGRWFVNMLLLCSPAADADADADAENENDRLLTDRKQMDRSIPRIA